MLGGAKLCKSDLRLARLQGVDLSDIAQDQGLAFIFIAEAILDRTQSEVSNLGGDR